MSRYPALVRLAGDLRPLTPRLTPADHRLLVVVALILWALGLVYGIRFAYAQLETTDFQTFHASAVAAQSGQPWYAGRLDRPNMNPPLVVVTLFAPFASLSLRTAWMIWTLLSLLALAVTLAQLWRAQLLTPLAWVALGLSLSLPALLPWMQAQITWLLLPLVTQAWICARRGELQAAGWWLAPVLAIKPTFVLFALLLPWRVWVPAGIGSAALTLLGVAWTGLEPWRDWLALSQTVTWLDDPANASLWGLVARLPTAWHTTASILSGCALLVSAVLVLRRTAGDERWLAAFLWGTVASPLGWIYYLPLALGPLLGSRLTPLLFVALVCFAVPYAPLGPIVGASLSGMATLLALIGVLTATQQLRERAAGAVE